MIKQSFSSFLTVTFDLVWSCCFIKTLNCALCDLARLGHFVHTRFPKKAFKLLSFPSLTHTICAERSLWTEPRLLAVSEVTVNTVLICCLSFPTTIPQMMDLVRSTPKNPQRGVQISHTPPCAWYYTASKSSSNFALKYTHDYKTPDAA